jgi:fumarate hydratase class II
MNVNEVIAIRGNQIAKSKIIHPNDHVNMSQSTNDIYPSAANIAILKLVTSKLFPAVDNLIVSLKNIQNKGKDTIKLGRTHIQDALPITFGQEVEG